MQGKRLIQDLLGLVQAADFQQAFRGVGHQDAAGLAQHAEPGEFLHSVAAERRQLVDAFAQQQDVTEVDVRERDVQRIAGLVSEGQGGL